MRFSASRIKTWMECEQQAKFKYVDQLPQGPRNAKAAFGSIIHKVLEEHIVHQDLDRSVAQFKDLWLNPEKIGQEPEMWPKYTSWEGLRTRGIDLLKEYHDGIKWEQLTVIATEQEFLVPFGRHTLHGFIDRLDIRKSGNGQRLLRVVDYKTNSRKPNKAELYLNIQYTVYLYALTQPEFWAGLVDGEEWMEKTANLKRRGIWFHLMDAMEIDAGPRDEDDFGRLMRVCDAIEAAHEAEVFMPHIGDACLFCPYTEPCGQYIPTQEEVAASDGAWL